jgi:hypothetical protein
MGDVNSLYTVFDIKWYELEVEFWLTIYTLLSGEVTERFNLTFIRQNSIERRIVSEIKGNIKQSTKNKYFTKKFNGVNVKLL